MTKPTDPLKAEQWKQKQREYMRKYQAEKYAQDPKFREKHKARSKARYEKLRADPEYRAAENAKRLEQFKKRYATDPDFKKQVNQRGREQRARMGQDWRRGERLMRDYGIGPEAYAEMHRAQGGGCAVCTRISDDWLHVDHEHVAGFKDLPPVDKAKHVRGLLCRDCNHGIARFADDPATLRAAAAFLERRAPSQP